MQKKETVKLFGDECNRKETLKIAKGLAVLGPIAGTVYVLFVTLLKMNGAEGGPEFKEALINAGLITTAVEVTAGGFAVFAKLFMKKPNQR